MTCSMLSASIAVAVPKKYIRKPGCRKAAKDAGATGSAPPESVAVANQTPGSSVGRWPVHSRRRALVEALAANGSNNIRLSAPIESCAACGQLGQCGPIVFGAPGSDQLHETVAQGAGERHRHAVGIGGGHRESDILQPEGSGETGGLVFFAGNHGAVEFVNRGCEQGAREDIEELGSVDTVSSRQGNGLAHRLDCARDHEVAGDLHGVRTLGAITDRPGLLADDGKNRLGALNGG